MMHALNSSWCQPGRCCSWLVFSSFLLSTEEFDYNEEERYECKGGEMFGNQRRFPGPIFWDYKVQSWVENYGSFSVNTF